MHRGEPRPAPPLPRGLILLASVWLFVSWILSMGLRPPLQSATSSYVPGVRLMILSTAVGALVAWPLLRLSQSATRFPIRAVLLDLLVVLGMTNMVLWPLRLVTPWPAERMACLMLLIAAWVVATGAVVSIAWSSSRAWARLLGMFAALLLALGWLPLRAIVPEWVSPFPSVFGGPIEAVLALADSGGAPPSVREWIALEAAAGVALVLWAAALLRAAGRRLPAPNATDRLVPWN